MGTVVRAGGGRSHSRETTSRLARARRGCRLEVALCRRSAAQWACRGSAVRGGPRPPGPPALWTQAAGQLDPGVQPRAVSCRLQSHCHGHPLALVQAWRRWWASPHAHLAVWQWRASPWVKVWGAWPPLGCPEDPEGRRVLGAWLPQGWRPGRVWGTIREGVLGWDPPPQLGWALAGRPGLGAGPVLRAGGRACSATPPRSQAWPSEVRLGSWALGPWQNNTDSGGGLWEHGELTSGGSLWQLTSPLLHLSSKTALLRTFGAFKRF